MKYKFSFLLTLWFGIFAMQAANITPNTDSSNPFNQSASEIKKIAALTKKIINNTPMTQQEKAAIKNKNIPGLTVAPNQTWTWQIASLAGYFNNALYLRMLLSEFYCARCAVGASFFNNSTLAGNTNPSSFPALTSSNQPSPALLPGGFDQTTIQGFVKKAQTHVKNLRLYRSSNTPVASVNPLNTFAGVIIAPTQNFYNNLRYPNIQNNTMKNPWFFPYQQPSTQSNPAQPSSQSSPGVTTIAPIPLQSQPADPLGSGGSTASNSTGIQFQLSCDVQPGIGDTAKWYNNQTLMDITLTNYNQDKTLNGANYPSYLQSIQITIDGNAFPIYIYDPSQNTLPAQQDLINFFQRDPSIPWAFVIEVDGTLVNGAPAITGSIPAIVKLNPIEFSQYTTLNPTPSVQTLLNTPNDLYYNGVWNTEDGVDPASGLAIYRTPVARLLRGITNGYLTSWQYKPLMTTTDSDLRQWETATTPNPYKTPTKKQFQNNNPNMMFYALYGTRNGLNSLYITKENIPHILDIIKSPATAKPSYNYIPSPAPQETLSLMITNLQTAITNILNNKNSNLLQSQITKVQQAQAALTNLPSALQNAYTSYTNSSMTSPIQSTLTTLQTAYNSINWQNNANPVFFTKNFLKTIKTTASSLQKKVDNKTKLQIINNAQAAIAQVLTIKNLLQPQVTKVQKAQTALENLQYALTKNNKKAITAQLKSIRPILMAAANGINLQNNANPVLQNQRLYDNFLNTAKNFIDNSGQLINSFQELDNATGAPTWRYESVNTAIVVLGGVPNTSSITQSVTNPNGVVSGGGSGASGDNTNSNGIASGDSNTNSNGVVSGGGSSASGGNTNSNGVVSGGGSSGASGDNNPSANNGSTVISGGGSSGASGDNTNPTGVVSGGGSSGASGDNNPSANNGSTVISGGSSGLPSWLSGQPTTPSTPSTNSNNAVNGSGANNNSSASGSDGSTVVSGGSSSGASGDSADNDDNGLSWLSSQPTPPPVTSPNSAVNNSGVNSSSGYQQPTGQQPTTYAQPEQSEQYEQPEQQEYSGGYNYAQPEQSEQYERPEQQEYSGGYNYAQPEQSEQYERPEQEEYSGGYNYAQPEQSEQYERPEQQEYSGGYSYAQPEQSEQYERPEQEEYSGGYNYAQPEQSEQYERPEQEEYSGGYNYAQPEQSEQYERPEQEEYSGGYSYEQPEQYEQSTNMYDRYQNDYYSLNPISQSQGLFSKLLTYLDKPLHKIKKMFMKQSSKNEGILS